MAIPLIGAGIAGVAGLASSLLNRGSQQKTNERSERFSREMYGRQRADSLSDWHMQNAYNDPAAQMQRLSAAGLNPNLVYGDGAAAQVAQSAPRSSQQSSPSYQAPKMELGSVALQAMQMQQLQSTIAKTQAETKRIEADTQAMLYGNQFLTPEMFRTEYAQRKGKSDFGLISSEATATIQKLEAETKALLAGYIDKGFQPLRHDKTPGKSASHENLTLKRMQADIQGIMERTTGQQTENALKGYEEELIQKFNVSGSHAKDILNLLFKIILLKR